MKATGNNTATDRLWEIQQELTRINAMIDHARTPLGRAYNDLPTQDDADKEEVDDELEIQIQNLEAVIQDIDQLRIDLIDGTQELIA